MSVVEIHLAVNHIPIIGAGCAALLLLIGLAFRNSFVQKISLWFLLALTVITVVAYFSGDQAEDLVRALPGVSRQFLHLHARLARTALLTMAFVGLCSLATLLLARFPRLFTYCTRAVFAMTLVSIALFVLVGYLGGQVRHSEIRSMLAQSLSTNMVMLSVVGLMALITLATIIAALLHRDTLFTLPAPPLTGEQPLAQRVELPVSDRFRR